ncbi:MAG: FAD:protein FMN transferase [Opitutaceae bacterium]|nr:FAD:protein FMN transferase [Opitutaceae bacterium]
MVLAAQSQRLPPPAPAGPAAAGSLRKLAFPALGTTCEVQYATPGGSAQAAAFERAAVAWVQAFETKYSRFRSDSLVSRINRAAGHAWIEVDPEMEQLLQLCDTLHFMTQGVLDPTALPLIQLWNWKTAAPRVPSTEEIAAARRLVGWTKVQRTPGRIFLPEPGMALDFGGFGKEYAVDIVAQIALDHGIANALVDFGHDLRALGTPPGRPAWHIGLEDPQHPGTPWASVALSGSRGIASSGDYIRCFKIDGRRYGHIVDPRTGWPVANGCMQATIIAGTCLQAGILSTTAFVLGVPQGVDFVQSCPGAEGLLLTEKIRAQTRGFFQYVATH